MIGKGRVIVGDLFDIADRLKEIDDGYFIVRDYKSGKFQVHHREQRGSTLALTLPYDRLDFRTISLVRRTRAERKQKLLDEIEEYNKKLSKQILDDNKNKIFRGTGL